MDDLVLILALTAWFTLWFLRDTGHTRVRRGAGPRWAQRNLTPLPSTRRAHAGLSAGRYPRSARPPTLSDSTRVATWRWWGVAKDRS